jgi:hypothetical protein
MKVIKRFSVVLPDNDDNAPGVVPMPRQTFEGRLSYEQSQMWNDILSGANTEHDESGEQSDG